MAENGKPFVNKGGFEGMCDRLGACPDRRRRGRPQSDEEKKDGWLRVRELRPRMTEVSLKVAILKYS